MLTTHGPFLFPRLTRGLVAVGLFSAAGACSAPKAVPSDDVGAAGAELIGGRAGSLTNTGAVYYESAPYTLNGQGGPTEKCGGVMIGPNQILTAGHCVVQWTTSAAGVSTSNGDIDPVWAP